MIRPERHESVPPRATQAPGGKLPAPADDAAFDELQQVLIGEYSERMVEVRSQLGRLYTTLNELEQEVQRLNDIEALAEKIKPSLAPAISASIQDSRDSMVEALSPILDRLITSSIQNSQESMVNALMPIVDRLITSGVENSQDSMVKALMPIVDRLISTGVRDSRDSMVDALYPIIGRLVSRAVAEALRDLARRIDDQMRNALDVRLMARRVQARLTGISESELTLRQILPFQVIELFLIHRDSGLLLTVLAQDPQLSADSDIISGMLTAIRDFAQDAFGHGRAGELDEVQYGDKRILIESARYVYIALVSEGIEPSGFRTEVRHRLLDIEQAYLLTLRNYDGNAAPFAAAKTHLAPLLINAALQFESNAQLRVLRRRVAPSMRSAPVVKLMVGSLICVAVLALWRLWFVLG